MADQPDYAAKIAALLAKAEDPAATPQEAETYSRKAETLMVKWGISEAMAEAARVGKGMRSEKIVERMFTVHHRYYQAEVMLVNNIATGLGAIRVLKREAYNHTTHLYVIGYESDLNRMETLWRSLWLQAQNALKKWWKDYSFKPTRKSDVFKARREFLLSFGNAVGHRLAEMSKVETDAGEPGTALVLRDRGAQVEEEVANLHPHVKAAASMTARSYHGRTEGYEAGKRASLGHNNVGTGRAGELS